MYLAFVWNKKAVHTGMYVLSFCLEQKSCAALDKGITIVFVLRLDLISSLSSETAFSSGLGISCLNGENTIAKE
jgi:hypothetical protein